MTRRFFLPAGGSWLLAALLLSGCSATGALSGYETLAEAEALAAEIRWHGHLEQPGMETERSVVGFGLERLADATGNAAYRNDVGSWLEASIPSDEPLRLLSSDDIAAAALASSLIFHDGRQELDVLLEAADGDDDV